jgi:hypothetical protein
VFSIGYNVYTFSFGTKRKKKKKSPPIYQHNEVDDEQAEPIEFPNEKQVVVVGREKRWMDD